MRRPEHGSCRRRHLPRGRLQKLLKNRIGRNLHLGGAKQLLTCRRLPALLVRVLVLVLLVLVVLLVLLVLLLPLLLLP